MPFPLILLALGSFVIGTSEFVVVGLLQVIAKELHTTVANTGLLMSVYAIGVVVGAPLFTIATNGMRRNIVLFSLLALYSASNLLCALSPNYLLLMTGRLVAAMSHGSFFGIGAVVATHLVPHNRAGRAIAVMFFGLTLANVIGVPIGAIIGYEYGWRAPFAIISVLGGIVATMLIGCLPMIPGSVIGHWRKEIAVLREHTVLIALSITICTLASIFIILTYLSEFLKRQGHDDAVTMSIMLFIFGLGMTIGVTNGGTLADYWPKRSATILSMLLTISIGSFAFTGINVIAIGVNLFITGFCGASLVPGLQARVLRAAKCAPNLASSFNIGAFNIGNALGAGLGSMVLASHLSITWLAVIGTVCGMIGFVATVTAHHLE
ncbi:MFS transporter [Acetobacteraceae bacterium ESL0709]|nr:MFS transporter [Acetobacteraceae bacterium ESL0697]MDF7679070.1 MFS transporter [Acetobacteraceae bacterium ESL0709]